MDMGRFWMLPVLCGRWEGPMVAVVYDPEGKDGLWSDEGNMAKMVEEKCRHGTRVVRFPQAEGGEGAYPVNKLRNLGLREVKTTHYLMVDVDFVPSKGMEGVILEELRKGKESGWDDYYDHTALVVPAFERVGDPCSTGVECLSRFESGGYIPGDMDELKGMYKSGEVRVFQVTDNPTGHSTTDVEAFLGGEGEGSSKIRCFESNR